MATITVTINGQSLEVEPGTTVLEAAQRLGISIPTLCHHPLLPAIGACRLCVVEQTGDRMLHTACSTPVSRPVEIKTHSPRVLDSRRMTLELLLARCSHNTEPYARDTFQNLVYELGVRHQRFTSTVASMPMDTSSPAVAYNPNACIQCGLCVAACGDLQQVYAIHFDGRGVEQAVQPALRKPLADTECVACGQCTVFCPTGAFAEQDRVSDVLNILADERKFTIAMVFPSVGAAIAPEFDVEAGTDLTGAMINGLKKTGFDLVFNAGFGHDLVAIEAAFELKNRLASSERLPMILSTCPSLVRQIEHLHPDFIPNLSVNRSPGQTFGRILKTYYAERLGRDPADIVVVQITPCLASKAERTREGLDGVDVAITSREAARLLHTASGYHIAALPPESFDAPFHEASGPGMLSDISGGTMEAVLQTYYELETGNGLPEDTRAILRGTEPVREAELTIDGQNEPLRIAVAYDLGHGSDVLRRIRDGEARYHLVEVMACPGGCVGGGGQPGAYAPDTAQRIKEPLYRYDRDTPIDRPRNNVQLNRLYAEFLKTPFGEKSAELLHTTYTERSRY